MNAFNRTGKLIIAVAIVTFGSLQSVNASTFNDNTQPTSVEVNYSDLNLSNEAGRDALYSRLKSATTAVCGEQHSVKDAGSLKQLRLNNECFDNTMARAIGKFESTDLAQNMGN